MIFLFAAVIFTNAFLLFWVEPLVAKILLPYFGGSAGVWNTCVAFFQTALLAGYAYVHLGSQRPRVFWGVHLGLLLSALLTSFLLFSTDVSAWTGHPNLDLVLSLLTLIGVSFFVIASHGPLLQKWLPIRYHNPYFLFAASNTGSLIGLLSFPFVFEAWAPAQEQIKWWNYGLLFVCISVAVLALIVKPWRSEPEHQSLISSDIQWRQRGEWLVLSAVPSALMLAVTSFVSNEIAAAPLLWVVPLALYLLTFVIVFGPFDFLSVRLSKVVEGIAKLPVTARVGLSVGALALSVVAAFSTRESVFALMLFHFGLFFVVTLNLHNQLAASKPPPNQLTEFYLWLGLGGAVGGMTIAFIAPLVFTRVHEYPLALAAAIICWGRLQKIHISKWDVALPLLVGALGLGFAYLAHRGAWDFGFDMRVLLFALGGIVIFKGLNRIKVGVTILVLIWVGSFFPTKLGWWLKDARRSFYGAHKIYHDRDEDIYWLQHGDTVHGAQMTSADFPLTYYSPMGPLGEIFRVYRKQPDQQQTIALIGLGVGTAIFYAQPGDRWTVFELDPVVVDIAKDQRFFRYMHDSVADIDVVIGDGRLKIAEQPEEGFDMIVVDAFGSDSVPVHLLTKEAVAIYLKKIRPGGKLVFHASNRFFDIAPVIATVGNEFGLNAFVLEHTPGPQLNAVYKSRWVVLMEAEKHPFQHKNWRQVMPKDSAFLWTDQFSSILSLL